MSTTTTTGTNSTATTNAIPEDLRTYYSQHGVDVDLLANPDPNTAATSTGSRFIRLNPRFDKEETITLLKKEVGVIPIPWLDGFYSLPGNFSLSQSQCYQQARVYGMDVSSGAAVAALLSNQYDQQAQQDTPQTQPCRVLDLCCAPGVKLCALADALASNGTSTSSSSSTESVVVGVDVSPPRLATTKRILHKYRMLDQQEDDNNNNVRIRLYCGDGTLFDQTTQPPNLIFDSRAAREESVVNGKRKRMNKSARARERKHLKALTSIDFNNNNNNNNTPKPFHRVLVDAECSTDGSLKHIQKQLQTKSPQEVATLLTNPNQLKVLVELQKQLAAAGFRMLKEGGIMVYSTCSLSYDQNERVVQWLLNEYSDSAFLIPLDFAAKMENEAVKPKIQQGKWGVRFEPQVVSEGGDNKVCFGGGFFLAKIGKKHC